MRLMILHLFTLALLHVVKSTDFVNGSLVKFSGAPVNLTCYARDPIVWKHTIDNMTESDLRIERQLCSINQIKYYCSTLWFLATTNDTVLVQCFANNGTIRYAVSSYRIKVQGLLAAPQDLAVAHEITDCDGCIPLSWTPPPTLDVTDVEPDISMYTLYIKDMRTGMMTQRNVTMPRYTLSDLDRLKGRATSYEISVSAWNELGEGERCGSIDVRSKEPLNSAASFVNSIPVVITLIVAFLSQCITS